MPFRGLPAADAPGIVAVHDPHEPATGIAMTAKSGKTTKPRAARTPAATTRARTTKSTQPPSVAACLPVPGPAAIESAKRKFERGVIARDEAVPAGKPLPPGATHTIEGQHRDGTPILKRKRFSTR
jgi:hypothetical protein